MPLCLVIRECKDIVRVPITSPFAKTIGIVRSLRNASDREGWYLNLLGIASLDCGTVHC